MFHNDSQGALQHGAMTTTTRPGAEGGGPGFHADAIEHADVFGSVGDGTESEGGGGATAPPGGGGDGVRALTGCVLVVLIVSTLLGNTLVCAAVVKFRHLRSKVTNSFVISLAVSDLFVAVLVMPWRAASQVAGRWLFGPAFCDTWVAFDIMCSTASILNLCVISMDRYWAISSPFRYERKMTRRFACVMIGVAWTLSVLISFIPVRLNWHRAAAAPTDAHGNNNGTAVEPPRDADAPANDTEQDCNPSLNRTYAISSSLISFYIPVVIMVGTYTRIFRIAQTQIRRISSLERAAGQRALNRPLHHHHHHHHQNHHQNHQNQSHAHQSQSHGPHHSQNHGHNQNHSQSRHRGASNSTTNNHDESALKTSFKKETKVLKTLSIIMGVFVFCWLPFFVLNCVVPFCQDAEPGDPPCVSDNTFSIFVWFGWANSSLNPVIYAFNADFRKAFSTILGCNKFCSSSTVEAVDFSNELVSYHHDTTLQKETAPPAATTATGGGGGGGGGGGAAGGPGGGVQQRGPSCPGPRQQQQQRAPAGSEEEEEELLDPDRAFGIAQLLRFECEAEISLDMMPFNSSGPADRYPAIPGQVGDL